MTKFKKTARQQREPHTSCIYSGPSMFPLLKPGDKVFIAPYKNRKIRCGDVIVFNHPRSGKKIIHRVFRKDKRGIQTRGDNNNRIDPWLLQTDNILGRVVSLRRGKRLKKILASFPGRLVGFFLITRRRAATCLSSLLRAPYSRLARSCFFRVFLSRRFRPRIAAFKKQGGVELQIHLGRWMIGRRSRNRHRWHIKRPFRLLLDETSLPENPYKDKKKPITCPSR